MFLSLFLFTHFTAVHLSVEQWWNVTKYIYFSAVLFFLFLTSTFHFWLFYIFTTPLNFGGKYCTFYTTTFIWWTLVTITLQIACCVRAKVAHFKINVSYWQSDNKKKQIQMIRKMLHNVNPWYTVYNVHVNIFLIDFNLFYWYLGTFIARKLLLVLE